VQRVDVDDPVRGEGDGLEEALRGAALDDQVPAVATAEPLDVARRRPDERDVPQAEGLAGARQTLSDSLRLLLAALAVEVGVDEADETLVGRVAALTSERELLFDQRFVLSSNGRSDGWVFGSVGLQDDAASRRPASCPSGDLGQQLEEVLAGAEVGEIEGVIPGRSRPLAIICVPMSTCASPD
jgi:hypothetical protein